MFKPQRSVPAILVTIGLSTISTACAAQARYGYPAQRDSRDVERLAYDNGFRDGQQRGERDARDRRDFRVDRDSDYRNADSGYRGYGDRNGYRRFFRDGYQAGYAEGYNRVARYDRSGGGRIYPPVTAPDGYPNTRGVYGSGAAQTGYRDGLEAGLRDARDREINDFRRPKRYREGDHDYDSRYGQREEYKREYRAAFEQGYREGYGAARR